MSAASVAHHPQNVTRRSVTEDHRSCCRICAGLIAGSCCHVTPAGSVTRTPPCTGLPRDIATSRHRDFLHGVNGEIVACVEQRHLLAHHYGLVALRDRRAPDDGYRDPHSLPHAGELCEHDAHLCVHGSGSRPARSSAHVPSRVGARGSCWEEGVREHLRRWTGAGFRADWLMFDGSDAITIGGGSRSGFLM